MKTLGSILKSVPVWVNPTHRVESAIMLMLGHNLDGLPVFEGNKLVGILPNRRLLGVQGIKTVGELMDRVVSTANSDMNVRDAAELMMRENLDFLPVVDDAGDLMGMVTHGDLLAELRRAIDPITELPWSDTLREWAIDRLRQGQEIILLFLDVNRFGEFNKKYGHVVGDSVLRNVANVLQEISNPTTDCVCRYGGDEFCVASIRTSGDAEKLAEDIENEVLSLRVIEAQGVRIGVTIGLRGGRRTKERDQVHYAATLNNLINLASRDCIEKKSRKYDIIESSSQDGMNSQKKTAESDIPAFDNSGSNFFAKAPSDIPLQTERKDASPVAVPTYQKVAPDRGLHLSDLTVRWTGQEAHVLVELVRDLPSPKPNDVEPSSTKQVSTPCVTYSGQSSREVNEHDIHLLVVEATFHALKRALPIEYDLRLDEVLQVNSADDRTLITILGHFLTPTDIRPIAGSAFVGEDRNRAAAVAVLSATNRQMIGVLSQLEKHLE